jgi:hypothetical protein
MGCGRTFALNLYLNSFRQILLIFPEYSGCFFFNAFSSYYQYLAVLSSVLIFPPQNLGRTQMNCPTPQFSMAITPCSLCRLIRHRWSFSVCGAMQRHFSWQLAQSFRRKLPTVKSMSKCPISLHSGHPIYKQY